MSVDKICKFMSIDEMEVEDMFINRQIGREKIHCSFV